MVTPKKTSSVKDDNAKPLSRNLMRAALGISVVLALGAGGAFYYASNLSDHARHSEKDGKVQIFVNAKSCDPNVLTVPAGRTVFEIINQSERTVEWEILDGVIVLEERENIAPGFKQTLSAKLSPGEYQITCGLLSNPRGTLIVTPSASSAAEKGSLPLTAFLGALADYQIYLTAETMQFQKAVASLQAAIDDNNFEAAQAAYGQAREAYARIMPVTEAFSDLDTAINARADYFEKREQDPAFGGLHRLEYGLFFNRSLTGLAPIAAKLSNDAALLVPRIRAARISPDSMLKGTAAAFERFTATAGDLGDDHYAQTDWQNLSGLMAGASKVVDLLRPVISKSKEHAFDGIDKQMTLIKASIALDAKNQNFSSYDIISTDEKAKINGNVAALSAQFSKLRDQLGVE